MRKVLASVAACLFLGAPLPGQEGAPSLDALLELNAAEILGGEATAKAGRVVIRFPGKRLFSNAFNVTGPKGLGFISDDKDVKDVTLRQAIIDGAKGTFSVLGRDAGYAVSRFELGDELKISFRLRIARLFPNSIFNVSFLQKDPKNFVQSLFFRELVLVDGGKRKSKVTANKAYAGPAVSWFDKRPAGMPVEIIFKDKKAVVSITPEAAKEGAKTERIDLVTWEGIDRLSSGKVVFEFRNLLLLMTDLVIEGKYSREWAESEVARLTKAGKLTE